MTINSGKQEINLLTVSNRGLAALIERHLDRCQKDSSLNEDLLRCPKLAQAVNVLSVLSREAERRLRRASASNPFEADLAVRN